MAHRIAVLPGDGIGPEIAAPAIEILHTLGDFEFTEHLFGGASIDAHGTALTDEVLAACREADAVPLATRRGQSRGCWPCARSWGCSPTCARYACSPPWPTPPR